ncbi:uncharacterized protein LOC120083819 isoform X1 [Benincasa hispida]|uniref:uncharacterized protein LOC120083819 isoform X1 n=1 Tax=Benincasa hispida TaxID=102211 RepID=UPI0019007C82|nr:uncharacterized protein LOC120083819 isoform X1 [Benincasa hispida]
MDAKALAKSKRAHSQHHSKKSHSNQKQKPNESRKPLAKPNLLSQAAPNLLSNWDRYGEETGEDEATVHDLILPKSKGADYRHLIAEARSQMQSCITSMDDVLPRELSDGGSAMLAARGEGLLSWIEDDSFIVDETGTAIPEASFLSLNLHTLADQLQKLNVAQRLFIEEDILTSELLADEKTVCDQLSSQMQTSECQREARNIEISSVTEKVNIENGVRDATSRYFGSIHQDPTFNPSPTLSNQVHYNAHPIELDISSQTKAPKYTEQSNTKFTTGNPNEKVLKLEATTAEAELDMLLSSFSDTIDLNTAAASSSSRIDEVFKASPHLPNKGSYSTKKAPVAAELDDALDELLQDTSYLISHKEKPVNSQIQSLSPHSGTNSIPNDDFDSWLDSI